MTTPAQLIVTQDLDSKLILEVLPPGPTSEPVRIGAFLPPRLTAVVFVLSGVRERALASGEPAAVAGFLRLERLAALSTTLNPTLDPSVDAVRHYLSLIDRAVKRAVDKQAPGATHGRLFERGGSRGCRLLVDVEVSWEDDGAEPELAGTQPSGTTQPTASDDVAPHGQGNTGANHTTSQHSSVAGSRAAE